jgi:hypothetical protein
VVGVTKTKALESLVMAGFVRELDRLEGVPGVEHGLEQHLEAEVEQAAHDVVVSSGGGRAPSDVVLRPDLRVQSWGTGHLSHGSAERRRVHGLRKFARGSDGSTAA